MLLYHRIPPIYDRNSDVLILSSFPSAASRRDGFFYANPRNRFWAVMSAVLECPLPLSVEQKKEMLLTHRIALWDAAASCEVTGSSDASITRISPNDIASLLSECGARRIFTNGRTAHSIYQRMIRADTGRDAVCLPSTSPANASWDFPRLVLAWRALAAEADR